MKHLLVTNDFPPKVGGIQSYLWELWRRLPPESFGVLTTPHPDAAAFDAAQPYRIERVKARVLLPSPALVRTVDALADDLAADLVVLDPALPVGAIGPRLSRAYDVVVHGAEITVPGRLPGSRQLLGHVLRGARHIVAAGGYPLAEAERSAGRTLRSTLVPPGVDTDRFTPLTDAERSAVRRDFGVADDERLVFSFSRLVPRKGMDTLIEAAARLGDCVPRLRVLIGGTGRDTKRLAGLIERHGAPAELLGFVSDEDLPRLVGAADLSVMLCRDRWAGLEQEGFGIVFLEAAAAGVPQVAGSSGGAAEAVADGETGVVVDDPTDVDAVSRSIAELLEDPDRREAMGVASRRRAVSDFSYDGLARRLGDALEVDW